MSCPALSGAYIDIPAKIFIDLSQGHSVVSSQFASAQTAWYPWWGEKLIAPWKLYEGEWYTHLVYSPLLNIFFEITAHKIQIFDKSDQAVEQRFVPLLPAGGTDDNDNGKAKNTEDLLTMFNTKKKRMDTDWETRIVLSYVVHLAVFQQIKKAKKRPLRKVATIKKGTTTNHKP